jgi:hypothetical protein
MPLYWRVLLINAAILTWLLRELVAGLRFLGMQPKLELADRTRRLDG